jgi:hypothetical protein
MASSLTSLLVPATAGSVLFFVIGGVYYGKLFGAQFQKRMKRAPAADFVVCRQRSL